MRDPLPMGAPTLMMSPQAVSPRIVKAELKHWEHLGLRFPSSIEGINPQADYWKQHDNKGFAIDIQLTQIKL
ncbi:hypothetical protein G4B88_010690 [Cannabis sativa]|uniref:Uncharacterized protein n=1 Tax=Cannabis sativa TaxID=3483 RepID=A0A7J6EQR0_CANSA|nr:hypothetical protein G4B88_010690 [Cannabis sativa]